MNKKLFFFLELLFANSKMERYCLHVAKIMRFGTSHIGVF